MLIYFYRNWGFPEWYNASTEEPESANESRQIDMTQKEITKILSLKTTDIEEYRLEIRNALYKFID